MAHRDVCLAAGERAQRGLRVLAELRFCSRGLLACWTTAAPRTAPPHPRGAGLIPKSVEGADAKGQGSAEPGREPLGPVTVQLLSGQTLEFTDLCRGETVGGLLPRLETMKPLADGTRYQLLAGDRALQPDDELPQQSLTAVIVKLSLLQEVAGSWRKERGDNYFVGLKIREDGVYECNSGAVV
eukprot:CAMPEP_0197880450 /NCGR_PEP_ID=MMETSP1439-20131203/8257_1 /TAXON_ID=66791 /ORGANISM="Gonyaulax spinifera, Strain CCMP409" /LENGTH=183 /DNA_ID=CAMNT_0043500003 /DNA_START=72 /DNA_END=620 /DNA_ORIENTATION=+